MLYQFIIDYIEFPSTINKLYKENIAEEKW